MEWTLWIAVQVWIALIIVITLHELGHMPKRIKFYWNIIPSAEAIDGGSRIGGLIVNVALFSLIAINKPDSFLLILIGLIAWVHFMLYAVVGSFVPEPRDHKFGFSFWDTNKNKKYDPGEPIVNLRTYTFDDVNNDKWYLWVPAAIGAYLLFSPYYIPILRGLLSW